jgi:hypothetical protein
MKITNSVGFALSLVLLFLFVDTATAQPKPTTLSPQNPTILTQQQEELQNLVQLGHFVMG